MHLLFLDISTSELLIILVVVFLVFGPGKIPELARKIGKGVYEVKRASNDIKREINREVNKLEKDAKEGLDAAKVEIDDPYEETYGDNQIEEANEKPEEKQEEKQEEKPKDENQKLDQIF